MRPAPNRAGRTTGDLRSGGGRGRETRAQQIGRRETFGLAGGRGRETRALTARKTTRHCGAIGRLKMLRSLWVFGFCTLLAMFGVAPAWAGLVVSIDNATVAAGGTGSVEVDLTNNGSSSVAINDYAIQLVISPAGRNIHPARVYFANAPATRLARGLQLHLRRTTASRRFPLRSWVVLRKRSTTTTPSPRRIRRPTETRFRSLRARRTCWPSCRSPRSHSLTRKPATRSLLASTRPSEQAPIAVVRRRISTCWMRTTTRSSSVPLHE